MTSTPMRGRSEPNPQRGEVWYVNFDPSAGAELRKLRPAVVVSVPEVGRLPLRIVVPITDWKPAYATYPWFVEVPASAHNKLHKNSGADAFQVKSVSEDRFVSYLGDLTAAQVDEIADTIALCVGAP